MASNPYANKVQLADGTIVMDISGDTVTADKLLAGTTAHDKSGRQITGTFDMFELTVNELKALST